MAAPAVLGLEHPISTALALAAVVGLVLANGFFVATEFSLVAVRRTRIQHLAAEGNRRARTVLGRLDHLDTYIAATQLGITISSLALGWIGEPAVAQLIEPVVERLPFLSADTRSALTHPISFVVAFSIITMLHIVLGELAPKSLALQRPEATSLVASGPIHAFYLVFRPAIYVLNSVGNGVVRLFGVEPAKGHELVQSAEELMLAVGASREAGLVGQVAHDLVDRAFTFTDLAVRHVMVPRTEMTAIPRDATLGEVLRVAAASGFTRLPVYEQDTDHIVGVLNVKRLMPLLAELYGSASESAEFRVDAHMATPLLVPESVPAAAVLGRLRDGRTQLAVVLDEYGGTAGIVSLEDLVETLIGEVRDETESPALPATAGNGDLVLDGLTTLIEAREHHDLNIAGSDFDVETVGGYVFARLGQVPVVGDEVTVSEGEVLRVEEMDGLRVARVRIRPTEPSTVEMASDADGDIAGLTSEPTDRTASRSGVDSVSWTGQV